MPDSGRGLMAEDKYRIVIAVAGFQEEEFDSQVEKGLLTIDLLRQIPEEAKAKRIPINGQQAGFGKQRQLIDSAVGKGALVAPFRFQVSVMFTATKLTYSAVN